MSKQTDLINVTDAITISGSNVGIGTSNVGYVNANRNTLQVNGPTSSLIALAYGGTNAGYMFADANLTQLWSEGSRELNIGTASAGPITFKTNAQERLRIDSSGNLLVGTTTMNGEGITLNASNYLYAKRSGAAAGLFDRNTNDGDIVEFRKSGTTVGSIGSVGGTNLSIKSDDGVLYIGGDQNGAIRAINNLGSDQPRLDARNDATTDLGVGTNRFKDAYLSGGIYLGGVGSDNKLEDYEEGTFTPTITSYNGVADPTLTYTRQQGTYIKVGDLVYVNMIIDVSSASNLGGQLIQIGPLPFAIRSGEEAVGISNTSSYSPARGNHISVGCYSIIPTQMGFLTSNPGSGWSWEHTNIMPSGASSMRISTTYRT